MYCAFVYQHKTSVYSILSVSNPRIVCEQRHREHLSHLSPCIFQAIYMERYTTEQKIAMPNLNLLIYKNGSRRKLKGKPHGLISLLDIVDKVSVDVADTLATAMMIQKIHQHELGYGQLADFDLVPEMPNHIADMLGNLMLVPAFAEEWAEAEEALLALQETYTNTVPLEQRMRAAPGRKRDALRRSEHVPVFRPLLRILSSEFNVQSDRHLGGGGSSSSTRRQQRRWQQQEPPKLLPSFKTDDSLQALSLLLRTKRLLQQYMAGMLANLSAGGYMVLPADEQQPDLYDLPYLMKLQTLSILDPPDFCGKHTSYSVNCRRQHKLDGALQKLRYADYYASRPFCGNSNRWGLFARVPAMARLSSGKLAAPGRICCCHGRCRLCSSGGSLASSSQQELGKKSDASSASKACSSDSGCSSCATAQPAERAPHHTSSASGSSSSSRSHSSSNSGASSTSSSSSSSNYMYVKTSTISRCKINRSLSNSLGENINAVACSVTTRCTSSSSVAGGTTAAAVAANIHMAASTTAASTANNRAATSAAIKSWWKATFGKSGTSRETNSTGTAGSKDSDVGLEASDGTCCISASSACSKDKGRAADSAGVSWVKAAYLMCKAAA